MNEKEAISYLSNTAGDPTGGKRLYDLVRNILNVVSVEDYDVEVIVKGIARAYDAGFMDGYNGNM